MTTLPNPTTFPDASRIAVVAPYTRTALMPSPMFLIRTMPEESNGSDSANWLTNEVWLPIANRPISLPAESRTANIAL